MAHLPARQANGGGALAPSLKGADMVTAATMATIYRAEGSGDVCLRVADADGSVWVRQFRVMRHEGPGYVWEQQGQDWRQVYKGLGQTGDTLRCAAADLAQVIRREYRRMRREEARVAAFLGAGL
jgi:hypothetical protein